MSLLRSTIERIKSSLFLRNVATLATGTTLAQAVSIFTAPILYRIYDKEDYGTLGLYMAIVGIIGVFSTMQYNHAILLEKEDDDAKVVMWLNRLINIGIALITLLIVFFLGSEIGNMLGNESLMPWLYLAPVSIFFSGQGQIFSIWANRKKKYKVLTFNAIFTALLVPVVSISIGIFNNGPFGLFMGLIVSHTLPSIVLLVFLTRKEDLGLSYLKLGEIKGFIRQYKKFPIYSLPSQFVSSFTNQLPIYFLSSYAGPAAVGLYGLAVRMIGLPVQFIGRAINTVFRQRATEDFNREGNFRDIFNKTLKTLIFFSIPMVLVIIIFGKQLFSYVFGEEWAESGVIAQILIVMFALKLIISPLSYAYYIRQKLKEDALIHIYILVSSILIFLIGKNLLEDYYKVLIIFAINYSIIYLFYLLRSYKLAG